METFIPLHKLVKLVDAENIMNEKVRTVDSSLEIINVTSKLESHDLFPENFDSNPEFMITQTTDLNYKRLPQFQKHCKYCHKCNSPVSNCFQNQHEYEERKQKISCS